MNLGSTWNIPSKCLFRTAMKCRRLLPRKRSQAFGLSSKTGRPRIERVYVINLDRQPARWDEMKRELRRVLDWSGAELHNLTERFAAFDANHFIQEPEKDADVDPIYTLGDQLFVEPQPLALPARFELDSPIRMSRPEIAVARSHINVWRQVAASNHEYVLVLEDDVWFRSGFARQMDLAWGELETEGDRKSHFDILYLSYQEVKHGAPKTFLSNNMFRPTRGLWELSGYVISREGAGKLLRLLPCRGPADLWLNHQFGVLEVRALRRPIIRQRRDGSSTNLYSILPALTKIGAITSESASLFHVRPTKRPVFAFGPGGSGLSSLAMALSMLGYRCCGDLQAIPCCENDLLLAGRDDRIFDAYVNIGSLENEVRTLRLHYPHAKFIITTNTIRDAQEGVSQLPNELNGKEVAFLPLEAANKWRVLCEHLECAPPACSFPEMADLGQRQLLCSTAHLDAAVRCEIPKRDMSPWVVERHLRWQGIHSRSMDEGSGTPATLVRVSDYLESLDKSRWFPRDDTFTGNLALFRPDNIEFRTGTGAALNVRRESLGVREFSAASLSSRDQYLFGRFEAVIKASNVPGIVTGFFLHRDSPRQEIDVEIAGSRPDRLLANVFYNPGGEGARYDYGYRGAASYIDLGFNASEEYHHFAIEWSPCEIRWFVDKRLVHRRVEWQPTPIPHLPMVLHVNAWPSRSKELAGRLVNRRLPTTVFVRSIVVEAHLRRHRYNYEDSLL
jgi:GR25 family glycosyltransferase involved in LPS biosynthesis